MASLIHTFVSSDLYNRLPHINEVASAPEERKQDLVDLRTLLTKHNMSNEVNIRLIHKHFDTNAGEVMVFGKTTLPGHGTVQTMKPVLPPIGHRLQGIHFFVNANNSLQAYEYADHEVPDMGKFTAFLDEFCEIITQCGLQHIFGLKVKPTDKFDDMSWTEFEFHEKRGTVMIPDGMPMPNGSFEVSVTTEWDAASINDDSRTCKHKTTCSHGATKCTHCRHCNNHNAVEVHELNAGGIQTGLSLGGQEIMPGTPILNLVSLISVQAF